MKHLIAGLCLGIFLLSAGCSKAMLGPCYLAMQYRQSAEQFPEGNEKAALLGRADAAQRECDAQSAQIREREKREDMMQRR